MRRAWILAAAAPLPLLLLTRAWTYTAAGWLDPFVYQGYFDWLGGLGPFAENYKASRIPWLFTGWIVTQGLGAYWAQIVLAVTFLSASSLLAFLIARRVLATWPALAVGVGFAYWPWLYYGGGGGWEYHNTLLGPALLGGILAAIIAREGPTRKVVAAGAVFGALLLTCALLTTYAVVLLIPGAAAVLLTSPRNSSNRHVPHVLSRTAIFTAATIGGVSVALVAFGAISRIAGNSFLFFTPLWRYLEDQRRPENREVWRQAFGQAWPDAATWIAGVFLLALLTAAILVAALVRRQRSSAPVPLLPLALCVTSLVTLAGFIVLHAQGFVALYPEYMAFPLQISALLGLIGSLGLVGTGSSAVTAGRRTKPGASAWWAAPVLLAPVGALAASTTGFSLATPLTPATGTPLLLAMTWCFTLALGITVTIWALSTVGAAGVWRMFVAPVLVISLWLPMGMEIARGLSNFQSGVPCSSAEPSGSMVDAVRDALRESAAPGALPRPGGARVWGDPTTPTAEPGACTVSAHDVVNSVWESLHTAGPLSGTLERTSIADVPTASVAEAARTGQIVLVAGSEEAAAAAIDNLRARGGTLASLRFSVERISASRAVLYVARQVPPNR